VSRCRNKVVFDTKNSTTGGFCNTKIHFDHSSQMSGILLFKEEELTGMVEKEEPRKIYLQKNGRYAIYYRRSDSYRKLILEVEDKKIIIVTFINIPEIPKVKLENG